MSINFNQAPYFDDYDALKGYLRILFKPKIAVQARELTQAATIAQEQVKRIGDSLYNNGSQVSQGQLTYDANYQFIKLNDGTLNTSVISQLQALTSKIIITGVTTGVTAQLIQIVPNQGLDPTTFYVKYLNSGTNGTTKTFLTGENVTFGSGQLIGTISGIGTGSAASISQGIYYVNGYMVNVLAQTIILDKYTNSPSYRIGLSISDSIITADTDPSLFDNAQGSDNFSAPGADRYQIQLILSKLPITSTSDNSFIEIMRIVNGVIQKQVTSSSYSQILDVMAQRTEDSDGDFTVTPFSMTVQESLNTGSNGGLFTAAQGGDINKLVGILSPARAYVQGYEIETLTSTNVTINKARTTANQINGYTYAPIGNYIYVDKLFGNPNLSQFTQVQLGNSAVTVDGTLNGIKIGTAFVRAVEFSSGSIGNGSTSTPYPIFKLYLFDIQMNPGYDFTNDVRSFYIPGSLPCSGNVLRQFTLRNVSGTFTVGTTIANSDTVTSGVVVNWDNSTNNLLIQPVGNRGFSLNDQLYQAISSSNLATANVASGTVYNISKLMDVSDNALIFPLPNSVIGTVRAPDGTIQTTYTSRMTMQKTSSGSGPITFTTGTNQVFAPFNASDYVLTVNGALQDMSVLGYTFSSSNTVLSISNVPSGTVQLIATVNQESSQEKSKSLVKTTLNLSFSANYPTTISLGQADIFQLVSVIEASTGNDITNRYTLDNGQRDSHYDIGSITLLPGAQNSTDRLGLNITFSYFTHSSNGDYFSVDSYSNFTGDSTWYQKIPQYTSSVSRTTYNLRDCFDFRPVIDTTGNSFSSVGSLVKPGTSIIADFSYYLARTDKIYLDYTGNFNVLQGSPSLIPIEPPDPSGAMVLYIITLNPYTFSNKDLSITFIENRRYTMRDIGNIDSRVSVLEKTSVLSALEQQTSSSIITNVQTGQDRFKSGFQVDSFQGTDMSDTGKVDYNASVDMENNICRPSYTSDSLNLVFDSASSANYEYQAQKPNNNLITCPYSEVSFISQPYATTIENINPFSIYGWEGSVTLTPSSDNWYDTSVIPEVVVNDPKIRGVESKGVSTLWDNWDYNWVNPSSSAEFFSYIRPQWIKFSAKNLKPLTTFYVFFNNVNVTAQCRAFDSANPTNPTSLASSVALTTDATGNLQGWFQIVSGTWLCGRQVFRITDDILNAANTTSFTDAFFDVSGNIQTTQKTITSTSIAQNVKQTPGVTQFVEGVSNKPSETYNFYNPLAQSFMVAGNGTVGGVMLSSLNLYFATADTTLPVTIQIREFSNGAPTQRLVPLSEVVLTPNLVNLSVDGSVPTKFVFQSPIYLQEGVEYAFVVLSNSNNYSLYTSILGNTAINSQRIASTSPNVGTMFTSQNGSNWVPIIEEDIKFDINRCSFNTNSSGATIFFENPNLPYTPLPAQSIQTSNGSAMIRVLCPNHGMNVGSAVTLGIQNFYVQSNSSYNGITASQLVTGDVDANGYVYKTYTILYCTLDSFVIQTTGTASSSGLTGPPTLLVSTNRQMDVMMANIQQLVFPGTTTNWSIKTTSGQSINGTQKPYVKDSVFTPIVPGQDITFTSPKLIASPINESQFLSSTGAPIVSTRSLVLQANISTSQENLSPIIDTTRVSAIIIGNRIDYSTFNNYQVPVFDTPTEKAVTGSDIVFNQNGTITSTTTNLSTLSVGTYFAVKGTLHNNTTDPKWIKVTDSTPNSLTVVPTGSSLVNENAPVGTTLSPYTFFTDEIAPNGSSVAFSQIEKATILVTPASYLQVSLQAVLQANTAITVWYRTVPVGSSANLDNTKWSMMPVANFPNSLNNTDFVQLSWTSPAIADFISFQIKVTGRSTDTTSPILIKNLVSVALAT